MSSASASPVSSSIPAGWYPDPAGSDGTRWWNGVAWTSNVQPAFAPIAPVIPIFADDAASSSRTDGAYVPFQSTPQGTPGVKRSLTYTRSVWWISAEPIWTLVPQIVIVALVGLATPVSLTLGLAALNLVVWIVLIALAYSDRAALLAGGNGSAASPWWLLLSPFAYMIARSIHVRRWDASGWVPLIWWILASIVSPVLGVLGVFAVFGVLPF
jgi:hypothetical protein